MRWLRRRPRQVRYWLETFCAFGFNLYPFFVAASNSNAADSKSPTFCSNVFALFVYLVLNLRNFPTSQCSFLANDANVPRLFFALFCHFLYSSCIFCSNFKASFCFRADSIGPKKKRGAKKNPLTWREKNATGNRLSPGHVKMIATKKPRRTHFWKTPLVRKKIPW